MKKKFNSVAEFRMYVSKRILWSSALLLFVGAISIPGFVIDIELAPFIALLAPINTLYMGTVFKYIGGTIEQALSETEEKKEISKANLETINNIAGVISYLIPLHVLIIVFLIFAKAWFSIINFQEMSTAFAIVEAFFGGYMGAVVLPIFGSISPPASN